MTELNDPATLMCHYTRAQTAFDKILPKGRLWMNPYSKMRDPYENQYPFFRSAGGWGSDDRAQEKLFWDLQRRVAFSRASHTLLALTEGDRQPGDPIDQAFRCPWSRPRMWEQYAEDHAGACLVFDREELLEAVREDLSRTGSYWEGSVQYTVAGFAAAEGGAIMLDDFHEGALDDEVAIHVNKHHEDFFFLKTLDWATEYEYRFVFERAREGEGVYRYAPPGNYVSYGDALKWVVVGEKFPEWQLPGAEAVARRAKVELRQMSWELNRPHPARPKNKRIRRPKKPDSST